MTFNTNFSFQALPAEIRVVVYEKILEEDLASFDSHKGIYMSCRQIKKEMDV